jgi:hypothetical protein
MTPMNVHKAKQKLREDGIKKPDAQSKVDTNLRNTVLQLVKPAR